MRGLLSALIVAPVGIVAIVPITLGLADTQAAERPAARQSGQTLPAPKTAEKASVIAIHADPNVLFKTAGNCMPCHNSLIARSEERRVGKECRL